MFPEERAQGQEFVVDVSMAVAQFPPDDDLDATVDYGAVADTVVAAIASGPHQLIETLAQRIVSEVLAAQPLVQSVTVTVHKPEAPIAHRFGDVAVTLTRSRT